VNRAPANDGAAAGDRAKFRYCHLYRHIAYLFSLRANRRVDHPFEQPVAVNETRVQKKSLSSTPLTAKDGVEPGKSARRRAR
jgi:hypothetical protein